MRIRTFVASFALILGLSVQFLQTVQAQSQVLVSLYQGEEIELPEDFVARLDGNKLKVALKSFGLAQPALDREVMVSLIRENGQRTNVKPDQNGEITFNDVKEGLAALVVAGGPLSYAAIPFYAAPGKARADDAAVVPASFEVPVGSVDSSMIRTSVQSAGQAPAGMSSRSLTDYRPKAVNRFQVRLNASGNLDGRVIVPESGYESRPGAFNLTFYRNNIVVGQTTSTPEGLFVVSGLTSGVHTVFATGPAGHAAYAFEIIPSMGEDIPARLSRRVPSSAKFVSTQVTEQTPAPAVNVSTELNVVPADELVVLVIPPRLMPEVRNAIQQYYPAVPDVVSMGPEVPFAPGIGAPPGFGPGFGGGMGGGGLGGGAAGGGGAGIGGAGIGGLLGLAGLAVGIAAAADDGDSFNAPPATPIVP